MMGQKNLTLTSQLHSQIEEGHKKRLTVTGQHVAMPETDVDSVLRNKDGYPLDD